MRVSKIEREVREIKPRRLFGLVQTTFECYCCEDLVVGERGFEVRETVSGPEGWSLSAQVCLRCAPDKETAYKRLLG